MSQGRELFSLVNKINTDEGEADAKGLDRTEDFGQKQVAKNQGKDGGQKR